MAWLTARDCTVPNICMDADPLYPTIKPHPISISESRDASKSVEPLTRTEAPVKYYFIDFSISTRFLEGEPRVVTGTNGRDQDVPELSETVPYDPFKVDVFILGNTYKAYFVNKYRNFAFLKPLISAMTQEDPTTRINAREAQALLKRLLSRCSGAKLRWRLKSRREGAVESFVLDLVQLVREMRLQLRSLFGL